MHQSSDGKLHKTQADCETHERTLSMAPRVQAIVDSGNQSKFESDPRGQFIFKTELSSWIVENAEALRIALDNTPPKRTRKSKKQAGETTGQGGENPPPNDQQNS